MKHKSTEAQLTDVKHYNVNLVNDVTYLHRANMLKSKYDQGNAKISDHTKIKETEPGHINGRKNVIKVKQPALFLPQQDNCKTRKDI